MNDTHPTVQPRQRSRALRISVLSVALAALLPPLVGFVLDQSTSSSHGALSMLFTVLGFMVSLYLAPAVLFVCILVFLIQSIRRSSRA